MKTIALFLIVYCFNTFSHEGAHGPELKDSPKRAGRLTSVILAKEEALGPKAKLVYKAEIVRKKSESKVLVYFYDSQMNSLNLNKFSKLAKGMIITGRSGKEKEQLFELKLVNDHYEGSTPKPLSKRYNLEINFTENNNELLAAFENLD